MTRMMTRMMTRRRLSQVHTEQKVSRLQARNVRFARTGRFHWAAPSHIQPRSCSHGGGRLGIIILVA